MDEPPIVKLTNAVLLSALKKHASAIVVRGGDATGIVEFVIDGQLQEEMRPPLLLHQPMVRRLGIMANLPSFDKDQHAYGRIELQIGERAESAYFDVILRGHGAAMRAYVAVHGFMAPPPPMTPPGSEEPLR